MPSSLGSWHALYQSDSHTQTQPMSLICGNKTDSLSSIITVSFPNSACLNREAKGATFFADLTLLQLPFHSDREHELLSLTEKYILGFKVVFFSDRRRRDKIV